MALSRNTSRSPLRQSNSLAPEASAHLQRIGYSPKITRKVASMSIIAGVGIFVAEVALGTHGFQENVTQDERLGGASLAVAGLIGIIGGVISLGLDVLGYQQNPQHPSVAANNV